MSVSRSAATPSSASRPLLRRRSFWAGVATLLALAVVARTFLRPKPHQADALHGDAHEAPAALAAVLDKTPADARLALLLKNANDSSPGLRYASVDALGAFHDKSAIDAVEAAFADSSFMVRERALEVMPTLDRERGLHLLAAGLRDDDAEIRSIALTQIDAALHGRDPQAEKRLTPSLIAALDDSHVENVSRALHLLNKITGQPWTVKANAPKEQQQTAAAKWQAWWAQNRESLHIPPEFMNVAPVLPTRADPAPDVPIQDIDGKTIHAADLRGRVTLLNFWGTWCPPCKAEIPDLIRIHAAYKDKSLS